MITATEKYKSLIEGINAYQSVFIPISLAPHIYGVQETLGLLNTYSKELLRLKDEYEKKLSKENLSLETYLETFSPDMVEEWVWCVIEEAPHLENIYSSMSQNGSTWIEKTGEQISSGVVKGFWLRQSLADNPEEHQVYGIGKVFGVYGSVKPTPENYPYCDLHEVEVYQQFLQHEDKAKESSRKGLEKVKEVEEYFLKIRPELEGLIPQVLGELVKEATERLALQEKAQKAKEEQAKVVASLKKAGRPIPRNLR